MTPGEKHRTPRCLSRRPTPVRSLGITLLRRTARKALPEYVITDRYRFRLPARSTLLSRQPRSFCLHVMPRLSLVPVVGARWYDLEH
jgi:hypothetical protein